MNEEIKELLDNIDIWYKENDLDYTRWFGLEELKQLKDYITNLQEENERLTRFKYNIPNDKTTSVPTITKSYKKEYENYKSRCEKAIEYIEDNTYKSYETDYMDLTGIKELLNILNGGDE